MTKQLYFFDLPDEYFVVVDDDKCPVETFIKAHPEALEDMQDCYLDSLANIDPEWWNTWDDFEVCGGFEGKVHLYTQPTISLDTEIYEHLQLPDVHPCPVSELLDRAPHGYMVSERWAS